MDGLIHIYCGDGKGKTTCALGLGVRACGSGKKVLLVQFLKSGDSAERKALPMVPGFCMAEVPAKVVFTFQMTPQEKQAAAKLAADMLEEACRRSSEFDLLILDEVFGAIQAGILQEQQVLEFIREKPPQLELVMTGRNPSQAIQELADYITEMKKIKHPYEKGICARRGIEY